MLVSIIGSNTSGYLSGKLSVFLISISLFIGFVSVQVYLDLNRPIDELYYEKYDNVAVMFASLTDYKLGYDNNREGNDKFLLSILNEVISDFDKVNNSDVVKIEEVNQTGPKLRALDNKLIFSATANRKINAQNRENKNGGMDLHGGLWLRSNPERVIRFQ